MPNPNADKGKLFERELEKVLKGMGLKARRPRQTGSYDVGDIWIGDDVVVQAKAYANIADALRDGTKGAQLQAVHARRPFGVAAIKKPRGAIADAYIAMPLETFVRLLNSRSSPDQ